MPPHHNDADARPRTAADRYPVARKPEIAIGHSELAAKPPAAPGPRPPARVGDTGARVAQMLATASHVMAHAVRMVRAVNGRVMLVWTRAGVCWREGDNAGEHEKGRDEFLLHHHSFVGRADRARY